MENIKKSLREELGIAQNKIIVCFSAIFKPGKRVEDFIDLAKNCHENKKYHFILIGDGPERDLAVRYPHGNLTWVGRVSDVERYLIASDIYFFSSKFKQEMMPMALIEGIDMEKKIIAYPTEINNFLLDNMTFNDITDSSILNIPLPSGAELKHYDLEYGIKRLGEVLNISITKT